MSCRFDVRFDAFSFFRVRYFDLDIFGTLIFCVRFSPFDILCSLFCPFDTLSLWYFVFFRYFVSSKFYHFDISIALNILLRRCFVPLIFCDSDVLQLRSFVFRYLAFDILRFDILPFDILSWKRIGDAWLAMPFQN